MDISTSTLSQVQTKWPGSTEESKISSDGSGRRPLSDVKAGWNFKDKAVSRGSILVEGKARANSRAKSQG